MAEQYHQRGLVYLILCNCFLRLPKEVHMQTSFQAACAFLIDGFRRLAGKSLCQILQLIGHILTGICPFHLFNNSIKVLNLILSD